MLTAAAITRTLSAATHDCARSVRESEACHVSLGMALRPSSVPGASGKKVVVRTCHHQSGTMSRP